MQLKNTSLVSTLLLGVLGVPAFSAQGQIVHPDLKLTPPDGGADQVFGHDVEIDEGILVVGAPGDDALGSETGAAYVYDAMSGDLIVKLLADDGASGDLFGSRVAIADGIVVVGAPSDTHSNIASGSVYLFDATTGAQLAKLVANDASDGDLFGSSVAIDAGLVVVGAMFDDDQGDNSGSAYVFDANSGSQLAKLLPDVAAPASNHAFGVSVAIDAGTIGVGSRSYFVLGEGFTISGVYLFDTQGFDQTDVLRASNGTASDFFGEDIDIGSGLVAVGAWARSVFFDQSGAAYVFDASSGEEMHYIVPDDGHDRDNFGISVGIDNGTLIIGAHQDGDKGFNAGSAYLYDAQDGNLVEKILAQDGDAFDVFGTSVAIENELIAIGAIGDQDNGNDSGSVYVIGSDANACPGDFNDDGSLDFFDISDYLGAFNSGDLSADFDGDGNLNFFDVSDFLAAFSAGCP